MCCHGDTYREEELGGGVEVVAGWMLRALQDDSREGGWLDSTGMQWVEGSGRKWELDRQNKRKFPV